MAKLSAHGTEVARLKKVQVIAGTRYHVTLSFRSDGHIMRNLEARDIHDTTYGGSPHHVYGWKLYKKLGKHIARADYRENLLGIARSWRDQSAERGNIIEYKES